MTILSLRSHSRGLGLSPRRRAATGAAPPSIVQAGLVAEWRFNDGAGQVLTDYSGNGNHGTLGASSSVGSDDPTWTAQGLSFDGGDIVSFSNGLGIAGAQPRTVCYVAAPGAGADFGPFRWRISGASGTDWTLQNAGTHTRLKCQGFGHTDTTLPAIAAGVWHFGACSQSTSSFLTAKIYRNGAVEQSTAGGTINTANQLALGISDTTPRVMQIAYMLLYNRALSDAEVEHNRQVLKAIVASRGISLP